MNPDTNGRRGIGQGKQNNREKSEFLTFSAPLLRCLPHNGRFENNREMSMPPSGKW